MKKFLKAQRSPDYANLAGPVGTEDNLGGITTTMYYCPIGDFTTIADTAETLATFTTYANLATISSAHTFTGAKGFLTMYNTQDSGHVEYSRQGERDGYSYKIAAKFFYPGMAAAFLGFQRKAKNDRFIFIFVMADGVKLQVGSSAFPAYISPDKGGTATNSGGRRGFEFQIESMGSGPVIYSAAVTLHT